MSFIGGKDRKQGRSPVHFRLSMMRCVSKPSFYTAQLLLAYAEFLCGHPWAEPARRSKSDVRKEALVTGLGSSNPVRSTSQAGFCPALATRPSNRVRLLADVKTGNRKSAAP